MNKTKPNKLEHYKLMLNLSMYLGPIFAILVVLAGLGYNHYGKKVKELEKLQEQTELTTENKLVLKFSADNLTLGRIDAKGEKLDSNFLLIAYNVAIANTSSIQVTVEGLYLEYEFKGKTYSRDISLVATDTVISPKSKRKIANFPLLVPGGHIINLLAWEDIRRKIDNGKLLQPSEVLKGSAMFIIQLTTINDIKKIENPRITIHDYLGNKSITPIDFPDLNRICIVNKKFLLWNL